MCLQESALLRLYRRKSGRRNAVKFLQNGPKIEDGFKCTTRNILAPLTGVTQGTGATEASTNWLTSFHFSWIWETFLNLNVGAALIVEINLLRQRHYFCVRFLFTLQLLIVIPQCGKPASTTENVKKLVILKAYNNRTQNICWSGFVLTTV